MIISVDFDGTITKSSDPKDRGFNKIRPHCREVMNRLAGKGVKFVLLTGRHYRYVQEAVDLCEEWALPIDTTFPKTKMIADIYIDDKAYGAPYIDWLQIEEDLITRFNL